MPNAVLQALPPEAEAVGVVLRLGVLKANPAHRLYVPLGFAMVREKEYSHEMAAGAWGNGAMEMGRESYLTASYLTFSPLRKMWAGNRRRGRILLRNRSDVAALRSRARRALQTT